MSSLKKTPAPSPLAPPTGAPDAIVAPPAADVAHSNTVEKNGAPWPIREADLPGELGVSREHIRAVRQAELTQGVDWDQVRRGEVMLSAAGLERLKLKLGCLDAETPSVGEEPVPAAVAGGPPSVELVVVRSNFVNQRIITARRPEHTARPEHVVVVLVRAANLFRPGMTITAREVGPNKFEFRGPYPKKPIGVTMAEAAAAQLKGRQ